MTEKGRMTLICKFSWVRGKAENQEKRRLQRGADKELRM